MICKYCAAAADLVSAYKRKRDELSKADLFIGNAHVSVYGAVRTVANAFHGICSKSSCDCQHRINLATPY